AGLWPVAAGAALGFACRYVPWRPSRAPPEGDLVVLGESAVGAARRALVILGRAGATVPVPSLRRTALLLTLAARLERALARWSVAGTLLAAGVLVAWVALAIRLG